MRSTRPRAPRRCAWDCLLKASSGKPPWSRGAAGILPGMQLSLIHIWCCGGPLRAESGAAWRAVAACPGQCDHSFHEQHLGPDRFARTVVGNRLRGRQLLGPHRRFESAPAARSARSSLRRDQCRRLLRSVRLRPDPAGADSDHWLDGGDVVTGLDDADCRAAGAGAVHAVGTTAKACG